MAPASTSASRTGSAWVGAPGTASHRSCAMASPSSRSSARRLVASKPGSSRTSTSARSTMHQRMVPRSSTGSTNRSASAPPHAAATVPPTQPSAPTTSSESAEKPPINRPSARGPASVPSGPQRSIAAAATIVDRIGPGAHTRPSSSSTTAASGRPKPWPPCSDDTANPSHPRSRSSSQKGGSRSASASSEARAAAVASRAVTQRRTVDASSTWSSVIPMGMRVLLEVGAADRVGAGGGTARRR